MRLIISKEREKIGIVIEVRMRDDNEEKMLQNGVALIVAEKLIESS